ncbi:unnamed protein product, partial [Durusdinium trenchii]
MECPPLLEDVESPKEEPRRLVGSQSASWLPSLRPLSGVTPLRLHAQTAFLTAPKNWQGPISPASTQTGLATTLEDWTFTAEDWGTSSKAFQMKSGMTTASSVGLRKSKSDGALHGLSPKASRENDRAGGSIYSLAKHKRSGATSSGKTEFIDQAKLVKDFDRLTSALGEVKNLFEGFDPRRSPKQKVTLGDLLAGGGQGQKGNSGEGDDGDAQEALREAKERLAERLQAYKFARRIEPEMPPLGPLPPSGLSPRKPPLQTLVVRNTSQEAIKVWLPHNRKERISAFAE